MHAVTARASPPAEVTLFQIIMDDAGMECTDHSAAAEGRPAGWPGEPVYLDYNATTPVDARVAEAARPYWDQWFGNPSSDHAYGEQPRRAVARAREQVAALLGAAAGEIVFTGSGSEADQLAIRGALLAGLRARPGGTPRVITQVTEHPAVLDCCEALHRWHGADVTLLPVNGSGLVSPEAVADALASPAQAGDPAVVTVMLANNETGAMQPITEIAAAAHEHGALLHVDAAQAGGKTGIDVAALGADLLTVVGHKMYGPKGIAALYVRAGTALEPIIYGGGQERGLRSGTENVALIAALGAAAEVAAADLAGGAQARLASLRDRLHARLAAALPGRVELNGPPIRRLPTTLNVSITGLLGHELLAATPGVAASTGSACHSGQHRPSPVLTAMGLGEDRALAAIRLSVGRWTTEADTDSAATQLAAAAIRLIGPAGRAGEDAMTLRAGEDTPARTAGGHAEAVTGRG
jgi:cysteine desulfurase